jgi:NADH-quinone oxidoreductase subunit M
MLLLETGVLGVFTSLDLVLFFLFWEVELIPMYMLISIWGTGRKVYSAMKFVLYTIVGSSLMLAGILILGFAAGTFDMVELAQMDITEALIPLPAVFFLIFAAFAIKLPVFPFHTWLPDAHTDAPTAVSVILAGILLKMGGYGMLRLCVSILPDVAQDYAVYLTAFAAVNVVYGAIVTLRQTDLKRLIAYSSISHMGYVLLGIFALGQVSMVGATLQMFTHGTITGLLFVMVGLVYDRAHTRDIRVLSGLAHRMPLIATVFVIAGLASLGLPMMSGFVSSCGLPGSVSHKFHALRWWESC